MDCSADAHFAGNSIKEPLRLFGRTSSASLQTLQPLCSQSTREDEYPLSESVQHNIPIYNLANFNVDNEASTTALKDEWYCILLSGPGVFVLKQMYADTQLLEKVNSVLDEIINSEKSLDTGDHFAAGGANDRIWNAFSKHAMRDAASFVEYYSNAWLKHACEAWLGPGYRVTAQVNVVKPGGSAQKAHRDYHLGFQTTEACSKFPRATQIASQLLTLQGAVAHSDMPLESGPTKFLPFSQLLDHGYMVYRLPEAQDLFEKSCVSLPLEMGDGVFFNPALFHAAGENKTRDMRRSANLLQVSSAFGKPMEVINTVPLIEKCWTELEKLYEKEGMSLKVKSFIAALADGYPFPTNLDRIRPSSDGMSPDSQQDIIIRALTNQWGKEKTMEMLKSVKANLEG